MTPTLCQCGCGQTAPISKGNDARRGLVKGQPARFVKGHWRYEDRRGENNPGWRGRVASYNTLHTYLRRNYPKNGTCDECGEKKERTEYALLHGRVHSRNRDDYRELCVECHNEYDAHLRTGRPRKLVAA